MVLHHRESVPELAAAHELAKRDLDEIEVHRRLAGIGHHVDRIEVELHRDMVLVGLDVPIRLGLHLQCLA